MYIPIQCLCSGCFRVDVPPGVMQVFAGLSDWTDLSDADNIQEMIIAETHVHPEYSAVTVSNDVAVLILAEDLVYGNRVSAGCLPTSQVPAGTNCLVTGWGNTQCKCWGDGGAMGVDMG